MQATPRVEVSADKAKALTERIQDAGTEVVKAKACNYSMAPLHLWQMPACVTGLASTKASFCWRKSERGHLMTFPGVRTSI